MSLALGLQIVPTMPVEELLDTILVAEDLGYDYAMIADEGLMHDVYVMLGAAARVTSTIRLGAVTNPYTRHAAVTAAALATVNEVSGGRAFVTLVAGGTLVLDPMGIERNAPASVMADTLEILRNLWSGQQVTWRGSKYQLRDAQLSTGPHDIPIWIATRGERILTLAAESADGVVLMAKSDLNDAFKIIDKAGSPRRIYLDRMAYTPEMVEEAKEHYGYALMDSPRRLLENLGIDDTTIQDLRQAMNNGGPAAVAPLITDEMIAAFQIAGTPEQCRTDLNHLVQVHSFDAFIMNIISPGLEANTRLLTDVVSFTRGHGS